MSSYIEDHLGRKSVPRWTFVISEKELKKLKDVADDPSRNSSSDIKTALGVVEKYLAVVPAHQTESSYEKIKRVQDSDRVLALVCFGHFAPNLQENQLGISLQDVSKQIEGFEEFVKSSKVINKWAASHGLPSLCLDRVRRLKTIVDGASTGQMHVHQYDKDNQDVSGRSYVLYSCDTTRQAEGYWGVHGDVISNLSRAKLFESESAAKTFAERSRVFSQWQIVEVEVAIKALGPKVDSSNAQLQSDLSSGRLYDLIAKVQKNELEEALKNHSIEQIVAKWNELHPNEHVDAPQRPKKRM